MIRPTEAFFSPREAFGARPETEIVSWRRRNVLQLFMNWLFYEYVKIRARSFAGGEESLVVIEFVQPFGGREA